MDSLSESKSDLRNRNLVFARESNSEIDLEDLDQVESVFEKIVSIWNSGCQLAQEGLQWSH